MAPMSTRRKLMKALTLNFGPVRDDAAGSLRRGIEQAQTFLETEHKRRSRKHPRQRTTRGDNADRADAVIDWPTGSHVENMSVALAVCDKMPPIIAGGGNSIVVDGEPGPTLPRAARIFEPDVPCRFALRRWAKNADIGPEINQDTWDAILRQQQRHLIHGVLLAHSSQVNRHSGLGQRNFSRCALHFAPSNQFLRGGDCGVVRDYRRILFPVPESN